MNEYLGKGSVKNCQVLICISMDYTFSVSIII